MTVDGLDPITVEIVTQRLLGVTVETADTLERVGGTVNTVQMKDYVTAVYRADGALVATTAELIFHVYCCGRAVREVVDRYGSSIRGGDMFILNDPYVAAVHQSDLYLISPIFFEGVLVGWSATFVHMMDIGAMSPGGNSPMAREVEHEGLRFGALRLVEDGVLRDDIVELLAGMTRQPEMVVLDLRSELAANFTARDRVVQLYERYGAKVVDAVNGHNIETGRKIFESRLAEIDDATLHESVELVARPDEPPAMFACTLTKEGTSLDFDWTASSPQVDVGINLPEQATFGGCAEAVMKTVARDVQKSEGLFAPIHSRTTPGSVVSARYPAPVSMSTTSGGAAQRFVARSLVSRLLATNERWHRAASTRSLGRRSVRHAGRSQYGPYYVSVLSPVQGGGSSARRDGTDCSADVATHNVEWLEEHFPLLQLYRRYRVDPGGAGQHRGGLGEESAYKLHGAPDGHLRLVSYGSLRPLGGHGLFGGHPGAAGEMLVYRGQRIRWSESTAAFRCAGEPLVPLYDDLTLDHDDVLLLRSSSGPGFGDPLLRQPEAVLHDVLARHLPVEAADRRYGVVLGDGSVDLAATTARRGDLRRARRQAAVGAGWREGDAPAGLDPTCDPDAGTCRQVFLGDHPGLPVVRASAGILGWDWAQGYAEPIVQQTFCPVCWSLIDCVVAPATG